MSESKEMLRQFVARIERLEEEKAGLAAEIRDVYAEAKGSGFDVKILRKIVGLRKMDEAERQEQEALIDQYMHALGMLSDLPLGKAAMAAAERLRDAGVAVTYTEGSAAHV